MSIFTSVILFEFIKILLLSMESGKLSIIGRSVYVTGILVNHCGCIFQMGSRFSERTIQWFGHPSGLLVIRSVDHEVIYFLI